MKDFQERFGSQPRTQSLRRINSGGELSRLWAQVRKAKNRGSLARRGEKWVHALQEYCNDAHIGSDRQSRRITTYRDRDTGRMSVTSHGGQQTYPAIKVTFVKALPGSHGDWRRQLFKGIYEIRIASQPSLDDMRNTLVHEALHMIDDMAGLLDAGHGKLWQDRLAVMLKKFPTMEFGKRPLQ